MIGRLLCVAIGLLAALAAPPTRAATPEAWLTSSDHSRILAPNVGTSTGGADVAVAINSSRPMQRIDGFGFALTGGSALLLQRMSPGARHALLTELFSRGPNGIGVSWLRISIGSSDLDDHVFSYDDLPPGATDPTLRGFSLAPDERALIPTLREILVIAPGLPVLASPWSPPAWMKSNGRPKGGMLQPGMDDVFARYLVAYVQAMAAHGVPIAAVTLQNEPENANNTPSMLMPEPRQTELIAEHVGPAFRAAHLATHIIAFDHNCDHPDYPMAILNDPRASPYIAGTGFHLYEGTPSAMAQLHAARPDKGVWLTEQMVIDDPGTGRPTPVARPLARVVLGALANGANGVLLWNLAADPDYGPHSPDGGCAVCEGAVTLDGDRVTRNVAYAAIAQVSRFVPPGSVRIGSTPAGQSLPNVAFRTPGGAIVLVVANPDGGDHRLSLSAGGVSSAYVLPAGGALTVRWTVGH